MSAPPSTATSVRTSLALDHVGYVGADMGALRATMQRLGFACTDPRPLLREAADGGAPQSLQQESCHVVFGAGYLELSAVLTDDPRHHLGAYRARGTGLHILALGSDDVDARQARCRAVGIAVTAASNAARRIDYGTRHGEARFRWFMLEPHAAPDGLVCVVRNETPELVFQPAVQQHDNGAVALVEMALQVDDLQAAARRYGALLDVDVDGGAAARAGSVALALQGGSLWIATPAAFQARFGAAAAGIATPRFAAAGVRVTNLAAAATLLRARGVPCERRGAELVVPAHAACGAVMVFTE
jgi:hypothetical protein